MYFLVNKYGKLSPKVLKSALTDFYPVDTLAAAKIRLLDDVKMMDFTEKLPHIPKRRETTNRLTHEVDDMLALMQFIDERGRLSSLPRYVSSGPDNMPSIRMFEGDLQFLLSRLDKLEDNLVGFGSALAAINAQLQSRPTHHASLGGKVLSTTQFKANAKPMAGSSTSSIISQPSTQAGIPTLSPLISVEDNEFPALKNSWAERTASTPNVHRSSRDKPLSSQSESNDDQFTEVRSRKKRSRLLTNEPTTEDTAQSRSHSAKPKNRPLMIGKMSSDGTATSRLITAAQQKNQFMKKAVFYVGNVDKAVTVEQMRAFVTGLSVEVLSLFEAKPRQPLRFISAETMVDCTTAFRLCINKDHCDRLLDDTKWPAFISVSEWSFKPPAQPVPPTPITQIGTSSKRVAVDNVVVLNEVVNDSEQLNNSDNADNTIIMCDHSQDQLVSTPNIEDGE
jgi:hypothetical protein